MDNKSKEDVLVPKGFPSGQKSKWSSGLTGNFCPQNKPLLYFRMKTTNLNLYPQLKPNLDSIFDEVWSQVKAMHCAAREDGKPNWVALKLPVERVVGSAFACPTAAPSCIHAFLSTWFAATPSIYPAGEMKKHLYSSLISQIKILRLRKIHTFWWKIHIKSFYTVQELTASQASPLKYQRWSSNQGTF